MTAAFRNPYAATASGIALIGKPRARQSVTIPTKVYDRNGLVFPARVLVVPFGSETGEYYAVYCQRVLTALEAGETPEYLELEVYEPETELS